MKRKKDVAILDVTIRDGSYAIDYQYTTAQVARIAAALDAAGINYIEVSHGCGLGAAENLKIPAAASDSQYVKAAKASVKRARIGVIAGPPPVTYPKDIDTVIEDVDFIRFAANCNAPELVRSNINYALRKRPKLPIFMQLMRSARRTTKDIIAAGRQAQEMGVNTLYIVDTAGHMIPEEVGELIGTLTAKIKIDIGFHGHNNLGMAIANSLAAVSSGASAVDASLKGIGRAGGNAQLEALVSLLRRFKMARRVDFDLLVRAGEELVAPIMPPSFGIAGIDMRTADANIDLYPLALYEQRASEAGISIEKLITLLSRDKKMVEVGPNELARAVKKIRP